MVSGVSLTDLCSVPVWVLMVWILFVIILASRIGSR